MRECSSCKEEAHYHVKGSGKWYCEACAKETFGHLNLSFLEHD
ncbi:MAG TPA: hypothetical protein VJB08_01040 [Candidatus Nanoarchaeia archaeon]|nr:hypothetical protein [Candidatus Nanoarchaeia archaeon]